MYAIVCIDRNDHDEREIKYMNFDAEDTLQTLFHVAKLMRDDYDEIYIVPFDTMSIDRIEELIENAVEIW